MRVGGSARLADDPALPGHLAALIAAERPEVAIETGTGAGTGSTRLVCTAFQAAGAAPRRFATVDVSFPHWARARSALRDVPYVDCRWGRSVALPRATAFLYEDTMLRDRAQYDILIDDDRDPIGFYIREIAGPTRGTDGRPLLDDRGNATDELQFLLFEGEDLLARLLAAHADHAPLIVLDSAGGIGLLEFRIVLEAMGARRYSLLLPQTDHVKHHRSLQHIQASGSYRVVAQGTSWVLATHP